MNSATASDKQGCAPSCRAAPFCGANSEQRVLLEQQGALEPQPGAQPWLPLGSRVGDREDVHTAEGVFQPVRSSPMNAGPSGGAVTPIWLSAQEPEVAGKLETILDTLNSDIKELDELLNLVKRTGVGLNQEVTAASPASKGSSSTIKVNCRRMQKQAHLGLNLDMTEGSHIHIQSVIEHGSIWHYNQAMLDDARRIKAGDFLISVNGLQGDAASLMEELKLRDQSVVEIIRPTLWEVQLRRETGTSWGLGLSAAPMTMSLVITKVIAGAASAWNLQNPDAVLKKGDRILAVNGATGKASGEMLRMIQNITIASLQMSRPCVA